MSIDSVRSEVLVTSEVTSPTASSANTSGRRRSTVTTAAAGPRVVDERHEEQHR
jgi:hypothetical protein